VRTLSVGLGAAAATFVALFAVVGANYLVQFLGALSVFLAVEALLVGTAVWLNLNRRRVPEWIVVAAIVTAAVFLLLATQPTYLAPIKQH
jgi:hypothetical protein